VGRLKSIYHRTRKGRYEKARESQEVLLAMLYTYLPPARGREYATMTVSDNQTLTGNCMYVDGEKLEAGMLISHYKTERTYGPQSFILKGKEFRPLVKHLKIFLKQRQTLLRGNPDHGHLFIVSLICKYFIY
jgi:hypothetical protein